MYVYFVFFLFCFVCLFSKRDLFFLRKGMDGVGWLGGGDVGRIWKELEEGKPHQNSLYEKTVFTEIYIY